MKKFVNLGNEANAFYVDPTSIDVIGKHYADERWSTIWVGGKNYNVLHRIEKILQLIKESIDEN